MEISFNAPVDIQASHYSLLAAFEVFGKLLFQPVVSVYTDYYGYKNAFIVFTFLYIICIFFLKFYPKKLLVKK
jgi:MFS family permease